LIAGVGGLGSIWAKRAHSRCSDECDLLLIDSDDSSFEDSRQAHCLPLGESSEEGCAALPELASSHYLKSTAIMEKILEPVELLILLTGLGGGVGTGAAPALAAQASRKGAIVISIAGMPFEDHPTRRAIALPAFNKLEDASDVCAQLSLDRLAWQARSRGVDWRTRPSWVEDLVQGLILTLGQVGIINLDLMDLRSVVQRKGAATMIVAEGDANDPEGLFLKALSAPLASLEVIGASGCLLQLEGGRQMSIYQMEQVAEAFTRGLTDDAQVILGARHSDDLDGKMRVVAVVSGL
jgi:cell division protein FtsZ